MSRFKKCQRSQGRAELTSAAKGFFDASQRGDIIFPILLSLINHCQVP